MSSFSVGGLASGLDTKSIISQLMSIESAPKTQLEWKSQLWTARKTAWSDLNARLLSLQNSSNLLLNPATWAGASASSTPAPGAWGATSGNASLSATVSGTPTAATYAINVTQLAKGEVDTSTGSVPASTSGKRATGVMYEGSANVVEGDELITALTRSTGVSQGFNNNSTIKMAYTVNGVAQSATFTVTSTSTLEDFRAWAETTVGNGATAAWNAGKLEITTAPGTANSLSALTLTAKNAAGTNIANFNASAGVSTQTLAATDGGMSANGTLTVTSAGGSTWNVALAAGDTKAAVVAKINATSGIGVSASLDTSNNIVLRSTNTGALSAFTVSGTSAAQLGFVESQAAQDAQYTVDGTGYSSSTNTNVSGPIAGVALNFSGTTSTTLTIAQGASTGGATAQDTWVNATKAKIQDFVKQYNAVLDQVYQKTQGESRVTNPKTLGDYLQGPMARDVGYSQVAFDLRNQAMQSVQGLPAGATMLSEIGIKTDFSIGGGANNGHLTIDDAALDAALRANPTGVQDVLGKVGTGTGITADDGIVRRVSELVSQLRVGGRVDASMQGATAQIKSIQDSIDRAQDRLTRKQAYYEHMFASLESTLGKIQSQGSWLQGQLAQLSSGSGG
jgi:flagellar hook-associated protein 2